jgi:cytochrome c oxidase subunit 2
VKLFPEDVSAAGFVVDKLFYLALFLIGAAFLLVAASLVYFLVRYRARAGRKAYYTHGNSLKASGLTAALALTVFFAIDVNLAYHDHFAWETLWSRPTDPQTALRVEIMAEQFVWNIRYPGPDGKFGTADDVTTINQLYVPVDRPVLVALKSKDVIHSFFLPNFRIKQDALPGLATYASFKAKKSGTYDIACAEHCGLGHYRMRGNLIVEPEKEFESRLTAQTPEAPDKNWGWGWRI